MQPASQNRGSARTRRRSARGQAYDEEQAQTKTTPPGQPGQRSRQDINHGAVERASEFSFQTLDKNRTSQKSQNRINLTAKADGIPRAPSAAPANKVANQRQAGNLSSSPPIPHRLSAQAAAQLASVRNPFVGPSYGPGPSRDMLVPQQSQPPLGPPASYGPSSTASNQTHGFEMSMPLQSPRTFVSDGYHAGHAEYRERTHPNGTGLAMNLPGGSQSFHPVNVIRTRKDHDDDNDYPLPPRLRRVRRAVVSSDEELEDEHVEEEDRQDRDSIPPISTSNVNSTPGPERASPSQRFFATLYQPTEYGQLYSFNNDPRDTPNHFIDVTNTTQPAAPALDHAPLTASQTAHRRSRSANDEGLNPTASQRPRLEPDSAITVNDSHPAQPYHDENEYSEYENLDYSETTLLSMPPAHLIANMATPSTRKDRKGDCDASLQEILDEASVLFKCRMTTEDAYPDILKARTWAKAAITQAAMHHGVIIAPDATITHLVSCYSWHLRSEIGKEARIAVKSAKFAFNMAIDPDAIRHNQARAEYLLAGRTY